MWTESSERLETRCKESSSTPSSSYLSLGPWSPRFVSPESVIQDDGECSSTALDSITSLSWLDCTLSPENDDDPIYTCATPSLDWNEDMRLVYRPQEGEFEICPGELQEAYSRGTFHSFFWKIIAPEDEPDSSPWKGHRPLDPAYPVTPSPRPDRRRYAASRTPPTSPQPEPILTHAIHPSPENTSIEIVLQRVCGFFSSFRDVRARWIFNRDVPYLAEFPTKKS